VFLLVVFLTAGVLPAQAQQVDLRALDTYIEEARQDWNVPGMAVAIVKNGEVVFSKGYGTRKVNTEQPVDESTLFAIGSNTKAFTATALGMLVQEGRLDWDDPATKHLVGFRLSNPYITREITVCDLLSHRSGLGRRGDLLWYGSDFSREEILQRIRFLEPNSSFRSQFGYQNVMFLATGQVIPAVTDTSWDNFVDERLFVPLDMARSNTSVDVLDDLSNVARPYTEIDGEVVAIPYRNLDNVGPAGSINSSVAEMAHWIRMQLNQGAYQSRAIVDSAIVKETHSPETLIEIGATTRKLFPSTHFVAYGLGWGLRDYHGRLIVDHSGGIDGMLSKVGLVPEEGLGVIILANYDESQLHSALFYRVVDAYLGAPEKDWSALFLKRAKQAEQRAKKRQAKMKEQRAEDTQPSLSLEAYAGTYEDDMYGTVEVRQEGEGSALRFNPALRGDLEHWHYDTFRVTWDDRQHGKDLVTFRPDAQGEVTGLALDQLVEEGTVFERVSDDGEATAAH